MLRANVLSVLLVGSLGFSASLAACGGNEAPSKTPNNTTTPTASASTTGDAPDASVSTPPHVEPAAKVSMLPIRTSTLGGKLTEKHLDPKALPPMSKLSHDQLMAVMKLFTQALGVSCNGCHQEGVFKAETKNKNISRKMWDEYAVKLSMANGDPVFCDSCHQGRAKVLDRSDKKAVAHWMDENFEHGLKQKNGGELSCGASQCHKDEDYQFLTKWAAMSK